MTPAPTLHVTNFASRGLHRGRVYTLMARPRKWEKGAGAVKTLLPSHAMLAAVQKGTIDVTLYRLDFVAHVRTADLPVGRLQAFDGKTPIVVADGDTLCCGCAKDAAAAGRCHRVWAAELLRRAGWNVVLDGRDLLGVDDSWCPKWAEVG